MLLTPVVRWLLYAMKPAADHLNISSVTATCLIHRLFILSHPQEKIKGLHDLAGSLGFLHACVLFAGMAYVS